MAQISKSAVHVDVRNIGGIDEASVTLSDGVSILTGRNATNRTSLLSAISGVLGGSTASLKSDADEGRVELALQDESYAIRYVRTAGGVRTDGDPYTADGEYVDLFVSLLEDNPARRAVERGDDLRDVIMRPVDTDAIEARIATLRGELAELDDELDRVERRRGELPALEERRRTLTDEVESLDARVGELRDAAADMEGELGGGDGSNELVERLEAARSERNAVETELEVKRAERNAMREELAELEAERESLPDVSTEDVAATERELEAARERKRALDEVVASLSTIVEFNDDLLRGGRALPGIETGDGDVAAALAPDASREVDCWTCGSRVERDVIADRLDDLRAVVGEKRDERGALANDIDELADELETYREATARRETLATEIERTLEKIDAREEAIEDLDAEADAVEESISDLEAELAETEAMEESDLPETYEEISDLEFKRGRKESELEDVEAEIDEIESLPEEVELMDRRDELRAELDEKRGRIDALEESAVDAFNDHMDELLDILGYDNLARVWIERKHGGPGGATEFALHVVRESESEAGYEDVVSHLSESEREVIGLVVALSGYLVHEVYERVPFMLLDSLEAIDAERIASLVEYFSSFSPYLVVALLPEDAAALSDDHHEVGAETLG